MDDIVSEVSTRARRLDGLGPTPVREAVLRELPRLAPPRERAHAIVLRALLTSGRRCRICDARLSRNVDRLLIDYTIVVVCPGCAQKWRGAIVGEVLPVAPE